MLNDALVYWHARLCWVIPVIALVIAPSIVTAESDTDSAAIEQKVLASRSAIHTIHVSLHIEEWSEAESEQKPHSMRLEVWYNGSSCRQDATPLSERHPYGYSSVRHVLCRNCQEKDHGYIFGANKTAITYFKINDEKKSIYRALVDPRLLGFSSQTHPNLMFDNPHTTIESDISSPSLTNRTVRRDELMGQPALVLTSTRKKTGVAHAVWVLPNQGYTIGRIEDTLTKDGVTYRKRLDVRPRLEPKSRIWYPERCELITAQNDTVTRREIITVEAVQINAPIDPSVFTLAGAGATNGQSVVIEGAGPEQQLMYQDGRIVARERRPATATAEPPPPEPVNPEAVIRFRWWYLAAALFFAATAVLFFLRALKKRAG